VEELEGVEEEARRARAAGEELHNKVNQMQLEARNMVGLLEESLTERTQLGEAAEVAERRASSMRQHQRVMARQLTDYVQVLATEVAGELGRRDGIQPSMAGTVMSELGQLREELAQRDLDMRKGQASTQAELERTKQELQRGQEALWRGHADLHKAASSKPVWSPSSQYHPQTPECTTPSTRLIDYSGSKCRLIDYSESPSDDGEV